MIFNDYHGKRVIISGCASGIGQATARALAGFGAEVHGVDIKDAKAGLASFEFIDLAAPKSIENAVGNIGGHVDALFNCAALPPMAQPLEILKVNFLGTRLFTEHVVNLMTKGGAIVSTSSCGGSHWRKHLQLLLEFLAIESFEDALAWYEEHQDSAGQPYAFGKEALNVWTMQQSSQLIQRGIRINTISPGSVQTPMLEAIDKIIPRELADAPTHTIGRRSTPEEQVGPMLFLNSSSASYVNGTDLPVDGGYWASLSVTGELWG